jgi:hypothetical protein
MDGLTQDLGYATRSLHRAPTFAVVAVVVLALGIGRSAFSGGRPEGLRYPSRAPCRRSALPDWIRSRCFVRHNWKYEVRSTK